VKKRRRGANDSQGMRYYPAFGVKSWLDALRRRFLSAGDKLSDSFGPTFLILGSS